MDYQPWLLESAEGWQTISPEAVQGHEKSLSVKFAHCNTREEAETYKQCHIAISPEQLPKLPKGEYYWSDLEGLKVINHLGIVLGEVSHLIATGSNDVMVVQGEREHMIPYLMDDYIVQIDLAAGELHVRWDADFLKVM